MADINLELDNTNLKKNSTSIVAIGASAGGLVAVTELLENLPGDTGMAFVYIQHLDPTHESALVAILQRSTQMKVLQAEQNMQVLPDQLYIIPPNTNLTLQDDIFQLSVRAPRPVKHSPIDDFFISLAQRKNSGSIGIILSGTATDGTIGLRAIKQAGGLIYAQDDSAIFQTMPKSSLADGLIDAVMSPRELAEEIIRLSNDANRLKPVLPNDFIEEEDSDESDQGDVEFNVEDFRKVLRLIKNVTGADFTNYKENTIRRRILRRIVLLKFTNLTDYLVFLKDNAHEVYLLYQDLLINVTEFFRDSEASEYLKQDILPGLIKAKSSSSPLRIWVPACSTGQEAYSMAMMILEVIEEHEITSGKSIQIFATDLSESAVSKAREGLFSGDELSNVSQKRLDQFFDRVDGQYRIIKRIRNICVFAQHNILKDPPFSKVDLVSCCNLLIYLNTILQKKIISNFHYALNKDGILVLGKSETISSAPHLFSPVEKKVKVFIRKSDAVSKPIIDFSYQSTDVLEAVERKEVTPVIRNVHRAENLDQVIDNILITQYIPPAVVINHDLDIVQFRGSTGLFLEPSPGKASLNLLKMVRTGLELEMRNAVHKAIKTGEPVKISGLDITHKGHIHHVAFEVTPLHNVAFDKLLLVVFEEVKTPLPADVKVNFSKDRRVKQLEAELIALREDMRAIVEDQEAANEELQSANEEIVSSNEELQSINEELETSKEELESSNEELMSINHELQVTNEQLSEAQDYTQHVIATIREAVIILDINLFVKSANKSFYRIFNERAESTEGKLIYEIGYGNWRIPQLRELLESILPRLGHVISFELTHKFTSIGEKVLLLNVKKIAQANSNYPFILLAIEDITEQRQAERLLEEREAWLRNMADNVPVMIWVAGPDKYFNYVNKTWLAFTGRSLGKETGFGWTEGLHKDDLEKVISAYHTSFEQKTPFNIEYRMRRYDGEFRWVLNVAVPTFDSKNEFSGYTGSCTEIHDKRLLSDELEHMVQERTRELQEVNEILEKSNSELAQFAYVASHDLQEPLRKITTFSKRLKERHEGVLPETGFELIKKISASAEKMRNLIDDLLDFSRISRLEKKFVTTDLNKVLKDVMSDLDLLIEEKKAVILADKLGVIQAVPLQMNQLLHNLLGNALKFTKEGTPPVITITGHKLPPEIVKNYSTLSPGTEYYEITVADNGIGFPEEFTEQIFGLFQRLNDRHNYPGTGIGLALCKKIVVNHGGEIYAKGEENNGAKFTVVLPISRAVSKKMEN